MVCPSIVSGRMGPTRTAGVRASAAAGKAKSAARSAVPGYSPAGALLSLRPSTACLSPTALALRATSSSAPRGGAARARSVVVSAGDRMRVLVTGASGRTGGLVAEKVRDRKDMEVVAMCRSDKGAATLAKVGFLEREVVRGDAMDPASLDAAFEGVDAAVIVTSGQPRLNPMSIIKVLIGKITGSGARPEFYYDEGAEPQKVDWEGQRNQFDAAKRAGVKQIVLVGSMGGTQPADENFLNTMGKDSSGKGGNILVWKRKAEMHLVASGVPYTIVHPGGLLDKDGGKRQILIGVDDGLIGGPEGSKPENKGSRQNRSIPRADVAEVCVQALTIPAACNRSFDIASKDEGDGAPTTDFAALLESLGGNCDYTINAPP